MSKSTQLLGKAQALMAAGDLLKAESLLLQLVQEFPGEAEAWYDLAGLQIRDGRLTDAETSLNKVLKLNPDNPPTWSRLGNLYWQMGRLADAATAFMRLAALDPNNIAAWNNLGNALLMMGRTDEAFRAYQKACETAPERPEPHNNLGAVLLGFGRFSEAAEAFARAVELAPDFAGAIINRAAALTRLEKWDEAKRECHKAMAIAPGLAEAHNLWGNILAHEGENLKAFQAYQKAVELRPSFVEAHINLGRLMQGIGRHQDAIGHLKRALGLDPNNASASDAMGLALQSLGQTGEAVGWHRRALELRQDFPDAHLNLGNAYLAAGLIDDAIFQYQELHRLRPQDQDAWDNFLLSLNYHPGLKPFDIFVEHRRWASELKIKTLPPASFRHDKPRIGYVSADFRAHSVAYFIEPVLACHKNIEVFLYSGVSNPDETTERIKAFAHKWRDVFALNDERLADLIKTDEIDILVDLSGHTAGNRLGVMAMKPAPITLTWLGYPNTTGLENLDWRLTDAFSDPLEDKGFYSEKLYRLPGFLCYQPPWDAPEVQPLPALGQGFVTFGSFNNLSKLSAFDVEIWSEILYKLPNSRLLLKSRALSDGWVKEQIQNRFAKTAIGPERLELLGRTPRVSQHLDAYALIDIALDPSHYNGTTTTCEALWMGRPVISLKGNHHAARVGNSILNRVGLPELIATSADQYINNALNLAQDLRHLQKLSSDLRGIMRGSPLLEAASFTRDLEIAYRQMLQGT